MENVIFVILYDFCLKCAFGLNIWYCPFLGVFWHFFAVALLDNGAILGKPTFQQMPQQPQCYKCAE